MKIAFLCLIGITFLMPKSADAYLDPGTGSYIVQSLIAILAAGFYIIKLYFGKIKSFWGSLFSKKDSEE